MCERHANAKSCIQEGSVDKSKWEGDRICSERCERTPSMFARALRDTRRIRGKVGFAKSTFVMHA